MTTKIQISDSKTRNNLSLFLRCVPALVFLLLFNYLPMFGAVVAFKRYSIAEGIWGSPWCGLQNFRFLFSTVDAWRITRNTILYNLTFIILNTMISLALAFALDGLKKKSGLKFFQTVNFFPHFLSWVVAGFMLYAFLQPQYGLLNRLLGLFGMEGVKWYMDASCWIVILPVMYVWKNAGYTSLIYYSGLLGIDSSIVEAARMDGANPRQVLFWVKLPELRPLIITMLLLAVGKIFYADFGLFYNLPRNIGILYETTDVIDTYVYRSLKITGDIGMGAAAGLYQSLLGFLLVMVTNTIVKKTEPDSALF